MRSPSPQLLRALRSAISKQPMLSNAAHHSSWSSNGLRCSSRNPCKLPSSTRAISTSSYLSSPPVSRSRPPATHDRGPPSEEDTQTDFGQMDILANMSTPATSIDACITDGFHLNNGIRTSGGSGILLLGGEAFTWRPWASASPANRIGELLNKAGTLNLSSTAWGLLEILHPKPDLLILGTGGKLWPISKETRQRLSQLGLRVDVMDTGNAAAAYNLLATERGVEGVGAALLPVGWKGR